MRYGIQLRTLGAFADPRETVRLAVAAEDAGWEALLAWDHLAWASRGTGSADPWVTLGACAAATSRITLGTAVTPLPRRRPQMVAQQLATLSLASGGRVVFGAGLGGPREEFERFGEDGDPRRRAGMLDEGLDVVARLLAGERVSHRGAHYTVDGLTLAPVPLRRVPFWIGGMSRPALRRAARWDGWLGDTSDAARNTCSADEIAERVAFLRAEGARPDFDVCFIGHAGQADLASYAAAGVTWWIENVREDPPAALRRVELGPPGETLLT
jgi:alkanesulfonate monooxygenase SsuD/methylene tetrahydromethanopterin reductase-like flavin-dependent oxidoreductase (luciferase family)